MWGQGGLQLPQAVPHQRLQLPREPHGPAPQQELLQQLREIPHQPGQQHDLGEQMGIVLGMLLWGKEGVIPTGNAALRRETAMPARTVTPC